LTAGGADSRVAFVWDLSAPDLRSSAVLLGDIETRVVSAAFSPDSRWLAAGCEDAKVHVWKVPLEHPEARAVTLSGHQAQINHTLWSPDGRRLVTIGGVSRSGEPDTVVRV
jgi:WD40 repeat protein